jgi:hypothetical protein
LGNSGKVSFSSKFKIGVKMAYLKDGVIVSLSPAWVPRGEGADFTKVRNTLSDVLSSVLGFFSPKEVEFSKYELPIDDSKMITVLRANGERTGFSKKFYDAIVSKGATLIIEKGTSRDINSFNSLEVIHDLIADKEFEAKQVMTKPKSEDIKLSSDKRN